MADEAFALSPISARAAQPSEEDYDAIRHAFMETSRGRWFLGEYAKRNRNADTSMVLEAVARLEENLAAQRQPQPAPDSGLKDALAAIRGAVDEAKLASLAALDGLALEDKLAPVRKGSRIIREIAWRWREIGADGRICDLLDSQVGAIEDACGHIASIDPMTPLSGAFDVIERQLAEFGDGKAAPASPQVAAEHVPPASAAPAPPDEMDAAVAEPFETAAAIDDFEAAIATSEAAEVTAAIMDVAAVAEISAEPMDATARTADAATETVGATAETADVTAETADVMAATADVTAEAVAVTAEAAAAHDDAILDMIALEMAADDPSDDDDVPDTGLDETSFVEVAPADPVSVAPEPMAAGAEPPAIEPSLQPSAELEDSAEPSLGSSLIARGILSRPQAAGSDPLAPIRRLSQAEKIAFFS